MSITYASAAHHLFWVLKNQHFIAQRQFEMLKLPDGEVKFLIAKCSLPQPRVVLQRTLCRQHLRHRKNPLPNTAVVQAAQQYQRI